VTLLDAQGRDVEQLREQWRVGALYSWLSDKKLQRMIVQHGVMSPGQLRAVGVRLGQCLHENKGRDPEDYVFQIDKDQLRLVMLQVLTNRVTRHAIARIAYQAEVEGWKAALEDYEDAMEQWTRDVSAWVQRDGPVEEKPLRPKRPTNAARKRSEVVAELQEERLKLEAWAGERVGRTVTL